MYNHSVFGAQPVCGLLIVSIFQFSLQKVLQNAFGVNLSYVQRVKVKAQCRVWRIFFQSRPHAHIELPESLQLPKIE